MATLLKPPRCDQSEAVNFAFLYKLSNQFVCLPVKLRKIPKDYVPSKTSSKLSPSEIRQRMEKWKEVLDLREGPNHGTEPNETWDSTAFCAVLDNMRELLYHMAQPVINTHFSTEFNKRHPDFSFGNSRRINCMDDFTDFIHEYNPAHAGAMPLKEARAMTHFVLYGIWGKSNFWAEKGEKEILKMLGFEFDGNRMCDGSVKKRKQRGGFGKHHLVKKLDMERAKVNSAWERCFYEKFFHRDNFKVPGNTGNKKRDRSHLRKYIRYCKRETDLFDGGYLLMEGHPEYEKVSGQVAAKEREQSEAEKKQALIKGVSEELMKFDLTDIVKGLDANGGGKQEVNELLKLLAKQTRCNVEQGTPIAVGPPPAKKARVVAAPKRVPAAPPSPDPSELTESTSEGGSSTSTSMDIESIAKDADEYSRSPLKVGTAALIGHAPAYYGLSQNSFILFICQGIDSSESPPRSEPRWVACKQARANELRTSTEEKISEVS